MGFRTLKLCLIIFTFLQKMAWHGGTAYEVDGLSDSDEPIYLHRPNLVLPKIFRNTAVRWHRDDI